MLERKITEVAEKRRKNRALMEPTSQNNKRHIFISGGFDMQKWIIMSTFIKVLSNHLRNSPFLIHTPFCISCRIRIANFVPYNVLFYFRI